MSHGSFSGNSSLSSTTQASLQASRRSSVHWKKFCDEAESMSEGVLLLHGLPKDPTNLSLDSTQTSNNGSTLSSNVSSAAPSRQRSRRSSVHWKKVGDGLTDESAFLLRGLPEGKVLREGKRFCDAVEEEGEDAVEEEIHYYEDDGDEEDVQEPVAPRPSLKKEPNSTDAESVGDKEKKFDKIFREIPDPVALVNAAIAKLPQYGKDDEEVPTREDDSKSSGTESGSETEEKTVRFSVTEVARCTYFISRKTL
eukprot:gnl/MRDRNA2_/MRDRNA2_242835_c0_seq1.p1 gnl/MRDRNA2_/MRDRNA2_242835_c0~~gnl/MRDRNA2_/MRDRNA2_242835_c0_seq1.p1  ORF type:complete len:279 (+),score=49.95 gnl/MRDRNA2_/MRDRNA2_242835_c0_seq1:80-838(+)